MKHLFTISVILVLLSSCSQDIGKLDYDSIEFQIRKSLMSPTYESLSMERIRSTEQETYLFYEAEIKHYTSDSDKRRKQLNFLLNNKDRWIKKYEDEQEEIRIKESEKKYDPNDYNIILDIEPELEYDFMVSSNKEQIDMNNRKLDSINELYRSVDKEEVYYILDYWVTTYSNEPESNLKQKVKVWVNNKSKVFRFKVQEVTFLEG
tara:strand:- start:19964 stop:20581 length:618 start_codon:yes stop_codon:yes gene_type:complete